MSPSEPAAVPPHDFRDPAKRVLWIGIILVVLLGVAAFSARPVYRYFKMRRAVHVAAEASRLLGENLMMEAGRRVQLALRLAPKHPDVLRVTARFCSALQQIDGLNYWEMLQEVSPLTREDRLAYAQLAIQVKRIEVARSLVVELLKEDRSDPETISLVLNLMERSEKASGMVIAQAVMARLPQDECALFRAGNLLLDHPSAEVRDQARRHVWAIAIGSGPCKLDAIYRMSLFPNLSRPALEMLNRSLGAVTNADVPAQLLAWDLRLRLSPEARPEGIAAISAMGGPQSPPEQRYRIARWLLNHREPDSVLEVLPFDDVKKQPPLLQLYLQALADLGRWDEVTQVLADPDVHVDPVMLFSFRAVAELRSGKRESALANFNNALSACKGNVEPLRIVADYSERVGFPEVAIEAWRQIMGDPELAKEGAREISRISRNLDDLQSSLSAVKRLMEFQPGEAALESEYAYLSLMLDTREPKATELAEKLFAADSKDPEKRMLAALAQHRRRNFPSALELMEVVGSGWTNASPRCQVVYAAVLGANNQRAAAREVARRLAAAKLKPQERELIRPWLPEPVDSR